MRLYYGSPDFADLTVEVYNQDPSGVLGKFSGDFHPDGWPKQRFLDKRKIRGNDVIYFCSLSTPADVFNNLGPIYAIPRFEAASLKVVLPDFPTGTEERLDADEDGEEEGKIATAMTLARMLSAAPLTACGPVKYVIYDIHALQEKFYFSDQVIPRLVSAVPLLKAKLEDEYPDDNLAIVLPDEGADKRFSRMLNGFYKIYCSKKREGDRRHVRIESGDPKGRHCVIVDDRVLSGGTILECKDRLFDAGAAKVSSFCTHAVFPRQSWKKFLNAGFHKFWFSNSKPVTAKEIDRQGPFECISLGRSIYTQILQ